MTFLEPLSYDIIIIGGGAAGFFTAINAAEMAPEARICILERGKELLTKVRISGGGRCNVTHAEFLPKELTRNYPRGEKELRGPFHSFMTGDTIEWFEKRGVPLKIEEDGRMFPESNSSETIIDLFLQESKRLKIEVLTKRAVQGLKQKDERLGNHDFPGKFHCRKSSCSNRQQSKNVGNAEGTGSQQLCPEYLLYSPSRLPIPELKIFPEWRQMPWFE